jgi:hypothetical protein
MGSDLLKTEHKLLARGSDLLKIEHKGLHLFKIELVGLVYFRNRAL